MTKEEIIALYKQEHDELSEAYYSGTSGMTKEEFDLAHGKVWSGMEAELIANGLLNLSVRYEAYTKELIHSKRLTPFYVDYEVLEFDQELTEDEIASLEAEMGKTVRRTADE